MAEIQKKGTLSLKEKWLRDQKIKDQYYNRGSRYPPFSIEPMPRHRQRLEKWMTEEERMLRKQWVKDQVLSPNEPRVVPEVKPLNVFRKAYMAPLDALQKHVLVPTLGPAVGGFIRWYVPKALMGAALGLWALYAVKFHPNDWTRIGGMHVYWQKSYGENPDLQNNDYMERGFKSRNVLLPPGASTQDS